MLWRRATLRSVPALTPAQRRRRARVERLIGLAAPALDAVLWAGERLSRVVAGDEPPRPPAPDSPVRGGPVPRRRTPP